VSSCAPHLPASNDPSPWADRSCAVAHHRIHYRDCGTGPVLVLLHGIGSGAGSWQLLAERLAPHMRVIAWDAPGYGDSDALTVAEPSASDYAERLQALVTTLGLQRFVLVGHSLGAMMAAAYAAKYPQQLHALLLADPAQGYANADPAARARARDDRVTLLTTLGADAYAEQRAGGLLRPEPSPEALQAVQASMRRLRPAGFAQACAMLANDDIWQYLPHWRGPLQVICGDVDSITPPDAVHALAQRMNAPFRCLPNAGHASYLDAPAAFAEAVLELAHAIPLAEQSS
jgi:pimeloyl-ACP methyl ester carboxylesterase